MKWRALGVLSSMIALAFAVGVFAFSTATVNSAASATVTATGQLLELIAHNPTDNPSAMVTRTAAGAGTGKIAIDFGHNGTASIGVQADSIYTYDNIIRVKNNNSTSKDIDVTIIAVPAGVTAELSIATYAAGVCGATSYSADPVAVNTATGAEVCVGFKFTFGSGLADAAQTLDFRVTAN